MYSFLQALLVTGGITLVVASPVLASVLLPDWELPRFLFAFSKDITITATPKWVQGPADFTLTYVDDYQIDITWTTGVDATNTMIRASYNGYPTSETDGVQVYFGALEAFSDTSVNFYENASVVYYRAWGENSGNYSSNYGEGYIGGATVLFIAMILLAGLLTHLARAKYLPLSMAASLVWLSMGILLLTSPLTIGLDTVSESWVQVLGFVFILMTIVPLTFQMKADIQHEKRVRPGEIRRWQTSAWSIAGMGKEPKKTSRERQAEFRREIRERRKETKDRQELSIGGR